MSFNKVIVTGNLTRNPEIRYTPNGTAVATLGLASNRRFKQGDDLKEEVLFVDVVAFGTHAENASKYLAKGSSVLVEGRLQQQRWETEDGQKRSKHQIVSQSITFLDKKGATEEHGQGEPGPWDMGEGQ